MQIRARVTITLARLPIKTHFLVPRVSTGPTEPVVHALTTTVNVHEYKQRAKNYSKISIPAFKLEWGFEGRGKKDSNFGRNSMKIGY